jgi:hypothetical protein
VSIGAVIASIGHQLQEIALRLQAQVPPQPPTPPASPPVGSPGTPLYDKLAVDTVANELAAETRRRLRYNTVDREQYWNNWAPGLQRVASDARYRRSLEQTSNPTQAFQDALVEADGLMRAWHLRNDDAPLRESDLFSQVPSQLVPDWWRDVGQHRFNATPQAEQALDDFVARGGNPRDIVQYSGGDWIIVRVKQSDGQAAQVHFGKDQIVRLSETVNDGPSDPLWKRAALAGVAVVLTGPEAMNAPDAAIGCLDNAQDVLRALGMPAPEPPRKLRYGKVYPI